MMKKYIYTMLLVLAGLGLMAQTNQPLPNDAVPLTNTIYLSPSDSTVWAADPFGGVSVSLGTVQKVDSLLALKADAAALADFYDKAQIDAFLALKADVSALDDFYTKLEVDGLLGGYVPTSRTVNGKALTGNITLNAGDVGALESGDNVSELVNDAGYITSGDIPAAPVTSVNGKTGAVTVTASDVGLGNVDNTGDLNKPISTATQSALNDKEDKSNKVTSLSSPNNTTYPTSQAVATAIAAVPINTYTVSNGLQMSSNNITPVYGTGANTVAQGNDSRINNGQTAYGWGDYRQWGLGIIAPVLTDGNTSSQTMIQGFGSSTPNIPITAPGTSITIRRTGTQLTRLISRVGASDIRYGYSLDDGNTWNYTTLWTSANFDAPTVFGRSINGYVPAPGGSGTTRYLREDGTWVDPSTGGGGGTATDLSVQNRTSTTLDIGSSTGAAATLPVATTSLGGLMTAADKTKLNSLSPYAAGTGISISGGDISVIYGTSSGTAAQGNDSRINNGQTAFSWGNHAGAGYMSQSVTYLPNGNTASGTVFNYTDNSTTNTPFSSAGTSLTIQRTSSNYTRIWQRSVSNQLWYGYTTDGGASWNYSQVWDTGNFTPSDYLKTANFTWANLSGKPSTFAPSAHTHNASDIDAGTLAAARIGNATVSNAKLANMAASTIKGRAGSTGAPQDLTAAQVRTILNVANGATANSSDATLLNRANHTGTQAISTVSGLQSALDGKMPTSWTITAGNGLTGGGTGAANRTLSVGAGDGITVNSTNVAVDGTVVRTTRTINGKALSANITLTASDVSAVPLSGNATISGTKTFSSPVVVQNVHGTATTASSSIPTNAQSLFTASVSSSTTYTLTNLTGNPRHIQVKVVNTGSNQITITFNARFPVNQTTTIGVGQTAIFTFLIESGLAWGTRTLYTSI